MNWPYEKISLSVTVVLSAFRDISAGSTGCLTFWGALMGTY